jgi:hypothetical protein
MRLDKTAQAFLIEWDPEREIGHHRLANSRHPGCDRARVNTLPPG